MSNQSDKRGYYNRLFHSASWAASQTLVLVYETTLECLLYSPHISPERRRRLKAKLNLVDPSSNYWYPMSALSHEDDKILNAYLDDKRIKEPKKDKMEVAKKKGAATTFHKFGELPYELQDIIWEFAADDLPARTIELRTIKMEKLGKLETYSMYIYSPLSRINIPPSAQRKPRHTHTFGSPTPPPALLSVSHHAREVAKRHYIFAFRPINSIFLDPATFSTEPYDQLIDAKNLTCPKCTCCTYGIYVDFSKDIFVAGKGVFGNEILQEEWADDFIAQLYDREVFHESNLSIHKIQRLALPLRSLWTRNMVTWHLGFLPGVKKIVLVRNRGYDKKAEMELKGKEVVVDARPPEGKDEGVYMARTRGFRVLSHILRIKEAKSIAQMMVDRRRLAVQDHTWEGPGKVNIWTATVRRKKEDGKVKTKAKKVWNTVNGKRLKNWMDKNYIPPNFG